MAKFLTTIELSYNVQQIIKMADKEILLITPYIKLSENLKDSLLDANRKGIEIILVYGKSELEWEVKNFLDRLENLSIYYHNNLHAKCYFNESMMLITSMNLHEFSEKRNKEFGILVTSQDDPYIYEDAIDEIKLLIQGSDLQKKSKSFASWHKSFITQPSGIEQFCKYLNDSYGSKEFSIQKVEYGLGNRDKILISKDFIQNVTIEIGKNIDFILNVRPNVCDQIFQKSQILSNPELISEYRVYWNPPYSLIKVYNSIEYRDKWELLENTVKFKYYKKAIDIIIAEIKKDFQNVIKST